MRQGLGDSTTPRVVVYSRMCSLTGKPMPSGITLYDILGILPGASVEQIQRAYQEKSRTLSSDRTAGAASNVVAAASRGRRALDEAWRVLTDPAMRERYDEHLGIRQKGSGLVAPGSVPSEPGETSLPDEFPVDVDDLGIGGYLFGALIHWLSPQPPPPRQATVPDVRGLFMSVCLQVVGKAGLRLNVIRLTAHPMPTDGLVVEQSPQPGVRVKRSSTLTVAVWHPPAPK